MGTITALLILLVVHNVDVWIKNERVESERLQNAMK